MKTILDRSARSSTDDDARAGAAFEDVLRALSRAPAVRPVDIDLVGRTVGRFVVKRRLGEGGMGIVYEAFDPVLGRPVALKVLRAAHRDGGGTRSRLHEEARRVAALHHPHIATVYDAGEHEGIVFLALERAAGRSLRARLAAPPALALPRTLAILRAIASGLACAHEAGIIHRDLKPENVVVGEDGTVKIIDFGIAAASGSGASAPSARPAGTRRYMAPEHAAGAPASARADVFAFGVLAREVLAATFVPGRDRSTRAALVRVINRCTAPEPEARPADGAALVAALEAISSPSRGVHGATLAATLGAAAVATLVGVAVARNAPAAPSAPATAAGPQVHAQDDAQVAAAAPRRRAAAPSEEAPLARAQEPAAPGRAHAPDRDDTGRDHDGAERDDRAAHGHAETAVGRDDRGSSGARSRGADSGVYNGALVAQAAQAAGTALDRHAEYDESGAYGPVVPVTTFVDENGKLTVQIPGYGVGGSGGARSTLSMKSLTAVEPVATLGPETAEAEVVSDGQGGAVIHLKLRVRPQQGGGSSTPPDPHGSAKAGKKWGVPAAKVIQGRPEDLIEQLLGPSSLEMSAFDVANPAPDLKMRPLCTGKEPDSVRMVLTEDGSTIVLASYDDDEGGEVMTVLAVVSASGELAAIAEGVVPCEEHGPEAYDG